MIYSISLKSRPTKRSKKSRNRRTKIFRKRMSINSITVASKYTNTIMSFMWKMMITYSTSGTLITTSQSSMKSSRLLVKAALGLSKKSGKYLISQISIKTKIHV